MKRAIKVVAFLLSPVLAMAQGGAPFRSDDPDTPANGHSEINIGFVGESSPSGGSYEAPNFDVNYGIGNRIQLKFEVPWSIERGSTSHKGLGNSMLGVKYRFHERHSKTHTRDGERKIRFSTSIYPQLVLAKPAPQMLLPLEASLEVRWLRISAEGGYWFKSKDAPNSWIRGIVLGHEFKKDTELYLELYDQQDVHTPAGMKNLRDSTIGIGGRIPVFKFFRVIGMAGHGLVPATPANGQPGWIAYAGIQFLSAGRRRAGDEP